MGWNFPPSSTFMTPAATASAADRYTTLVFAMSTSGGGQREPRQLRGLIGQRQRNESSGGLREVTALQDGGRLEGVIREHIHHPCPSHRSEP